MKGCNFKSKTKPQAQRIISFHKMPSSINSCSVLLQESETFNRMNANNECHDKEGT